MKQDGWLNLGWFEERLPGGKTGMVCQWLSLAQMLTVQIHLGEEEDGEFPNRSVVVHWSNGAKTTYTGEARERFLDAWGRAFGPWIEPRESNQLCHNAAAS